MTDAAAVKIDLYEYLEKCGGKETIRFDFVQGTDAQKFEAARAYAHTLREKLTALLGKDCPKIVAKGVRVIIEPADVSLEDMLNEAGASCGK